MANAVALRNIRELVEQAENGDREVLPAIREALDEHAPEIWRDYGDLACVVENKWIARISGDNLMVEEGVTRTLNAMKVELSGPNATPLEKLLIDRIGACWLQCHYADAIYAQGMEDVSQQLGDYLQRRQDRAHRRYLAAIKALAQVRRLLTPAVQVNVAQNQVNLAGDLDNPCP